MSTFEAIEGEEYPQINLTNFREPEPVAIPRRSPRRATRSRMPTHARHTRRRQARQPQAAQLAAIQEYPGPMNPEDLNERVSRESDDEWEEEDEFYQH